ncbi:MAG: DNA-deoxyinosine glycosylase [Flavobacterium sp.]|nr:DNA-deoxyinosine glycosylase [Candidatus Neoflavobacterium equi]
MIHGLPPIIASDAKVLILGTMPSEISLSEVAYYGNKQNKFWQIMSEILETDPELGYQDRLLVLKKHHIGLWDVIKSCERKGSLDTSISNILYNDIPALLRQYKELKTVVFSSANASKLYFKKMEHSSEITYLTMPSTSGVYARMPYQEKKAKWSEIKKYI